VVQLPRDFIVFDRKEEVKHSKNLKYPHCRYDMLKVKQVGERDFDVTNKAGVTNIVRYNDKVQHLTCTCEWGTQCLSSENFEKDCRHVKAVKQYMMMIKSDRN